MKFSDLTYMQKSDRKVLLVLLVVGLLSMMGVLFLGEDTKTTAFATGDSIQHMSEPSYQYYYSSDKSRHHYSKGGYQSSNRYIYNNVSGSQHKTLFTFDPNTADSTQLLSLGLAPWQVRSIYRYRAKGGVFRTPEDFGRVYNLTKKQYEELRPYIRISDDYQPAATYVGGRHRYSPYDPQDRDTLLYPIKLHQGEKIVLNTADTTTLKKVPGIGSGWARTIYNYGNYLGGYINVRQLLEIEGFPEELLSYFVIQNPNPHKIHINELTLNQLKRHPYINFYQARAITDYRRMNGKLESLNQLKLLKDFPEEAIKRLEPYVEY